MPPSSKRARLTVIKQPLGYVPVVHEANFPPMPRLYMELLENKKKVKPELKNKEYIPKNITSNFSPSLIDAEKINITETFRLEDKSFGEGSNQDAKHSPKSIESFIDSKKKKKGPIGIIDLSKMSADDISQMAKSSGSKKPENGNLKFEPSNEPFHDNINEAFPQSGPQLDEKYHRTRLTGKSEALSQIGKSPGAGNKSRSEYFNRSDEPSRNFFMEEEVKLPDKKSRGEFKDFREPKESREFKDQFFDRSKTRYHRREIDETNERDNNERDDQKYRNDRNDRDYRNDRSNRNDGDDRDDRDDRNEKELNRSKYREDDESGRDHEEADRSERHNDSSKRGLADIITPAAIGASLESVLSGKISSSEPFRNTPPKSNKSDIQQTAHVGSVPIQSAPTRPIGMAPSLKEIQEGKVVIDNNGIRDMKYTTPEEVNDENKKRDLQFKFKILKRSYPQAIIPDLGDHTPLSIYQREYDSIVRQLALDATVENYKKWLTIGFFVLEFAVSNFFKLEEIRGFATQQMVGMNQYEKALYAIGEQQALSGHKPWPPIVQLISAILLNGAIFVGSKMFFRATGANLLGMLGGQQPPQQTQPQMSQPGSHGFTMPGMGSAPANGGKARMRGPTVNLEELTGKKVN